VENLMRDERPDAGASPSSLPENDPQFEPRRAEQLRCKKLGEIPRFEFGHNSQAGSSPSVLTVAEFDGGENARPLPADETLLKLKIAWHRASPDVRQSFLKWLKGYAGEQSGWSPTHSFHHLRVAFVGGIFWGSMPLNTPGPLMAPDWSRQLIRPIELADGTVLHTLKDAAERILQLPDLPSTRVAAQRIIEAATMGGDMISTHAAVRLALLKGSVARQD
jgi:hypothetical protein